MEFQIICLNDILINLFECNLYFIYFDVIYTINILMKFKNNKLNEVLI